MKQAAAVVLIVTGLIAFGAGTSARPVEAVTMASYTRGLPDNIVEARDSLEGITRLDTEDILLGESCLQIVEGKDLLVARAYRAGKRVGHVRERAVPLGFVVIRDAEILDTLMVPERLQPNYSHAVRCWMSDPNTIGFLWARDASRERTGQEQIFEASYSTVDGFSPIRTVYDAEKGTLGTSSFHWSKQLRTIPLGNPSRRALVMHLHDQHTNVLLKKLSGGKWTLSETPITDSYYTSLVQMSPDRFCVGHLAGMWAYMPEHPNQQDRHTLFMTCSPDNGDTWEETQLVMLQGQVPAYNVNGAYVDGVLHWVFEKAFEKGYEKRELWHIFSTDEGRTWSEPARIPLKPTFALFQKPLFSGMDDNLSLFLEYHHYGHNPRRPTTVHLLEWNGAYWTGQDRQLELIPSGFGMGMSFPTAAVDADGNLQYVWHQALYGKDERNAWGDPTGLFQTTLDW